MREKPKGGRIVKFMVCFGYVITRPLMFGHFGLENPDLIAKHMALISKIGSSNGPHIKHFRSRRPLP